MKKNNMPLNLRERINSRISLLCSVIVVVEWFYIIVGGCFCEVLANVEERFVVMKIIPVQFFFFLIQK